MQPGGEHLGIEALRGRGRLLEDLADRVVERGQVEAQRIDLRLGRFRAIALEELLDAGVLHAGRIGGVVDDAVQLRAEVLHDWRELQADHAAADQLHRRADADLVDRAHQRHGVVRVGADEHHVGLGVPHRADHRREVDGGRRIALLVHGLQAALLRHGLGAVGQVLREFLVRGDEGDRLRAGLLSDLEEALGPAGRVAPGRIIEPLVVLHGVVHLEREVTHEQEVALLDERHDRRRRHGAVGRDQEVDFVDIEQLRVDAGRGRRVRLIVVGDQLDLAVEQPALLVDVFDPHLQREQRGLAAAAERARLRDADADLDRSLPLGERQRTAEYGGEKNCESLHDLLLEFLL